MRRDETAAVNHDMPFHSFPSESGCTLEVDVCTSWMMTMDAQGIAVERDGSGVANLARKKLD